MSLLFKANNGTRTALTSETWQQVNLNHRFRIIPHPLGFTIKFYCEKYDDRFINIVSSDNDTQIKYFNSEGELIDALRECGANL